MSSWPTHEFIRVIEGYRKYYGHIDPVYALRCRGGSYLILTDGPDAGYLSEGGGDRIDRWEAVVPVPADDLKNLQDELRGDDISDRSLAALLKVTYTLKSLETTPLDLAVTKVNNLLDGPSTLLDTSSDRYLALLLAALSTLQEVEHGPRPQVSQALATIVRICVQWVAEVAPTGSPYWDQGGEGVLLKVRARVESDPAVGGFPAMAVLAGDAATWVDEARETEEGRERLASGVIEPVFSVAHYALALLTENMRGEVEDCE
jgi:hypothetical protein